MSRPLLRGSTGGEHLFGNNPDLLDDSQMKDKMEKGGVDKNHPISNQTYLSFRFPFRFLFQDSPSTKRQSLGENGFASDHVNAINIRNRHKLAMLLVKLSLIMIVVIALTGSLWWTISITTTSRGYLFRGYRRLQEQLVSDLWDIGELSDGNPRLKEMEFCPQESENHVPCYNISDSVAMGFSDGQELDRHCGQGSLKNCLILPPLNYKIPLRWPTGKDVIWIENVKINAQEVLSSGSLTKRMMMLEEEQISFRSTSFTFDGIEDYSHQIAEMIGLRNESNFIQAGVRTILDIGCGYGSFGAHLFSKQLLTMCIANYEASGSQVQLTLERGLPAMIGSLNSTQLPFPSISYDMVHCARCGVDWDIKEGIFLIEVDRVLRPGGYFVLTSPLTNIQASIFYKGNEKGWKFVSDFSENLCWELLSQQDETVVWRKKSERSCDARKSGSATSICSKSQDVESPYYRPLQSCIAGTQSRRWIPIEERPTWPSRSKLNPSQLAIYGLHSDDFAEDSEHWTNAVHNYWSLLSPLIFSDHPKRPGDEDPSPPYNMLRNVLDMNAHYGGFNSALLEAGKSIWVMNVVPTSGPSNLPLILDRGFVGVLHDWCDPFPTYPRTYDMVHAQGLLTVETSQQQRCSSLDIFMEMDRLLRPEGWVIMRDTTGLIESARALATKLKWDARVVDIDSNGEEKLLVCQKPFFRRQVSQK
ncbi:probable pectin methyltransferase QUA2 [Impatiens glandulifera]|uniref:probable pectin methyltransferase QUA2 n=1 Tax=Impatiens glandulifera TaxID=253017 RepID=UPI001FB0F592|nr:probable pectin methyltransferase QUA2 [Impatiens glandulifera]